MAYLKTLLCLSVLLHCALSANLVSTQSGPERKELKRSWPESNAEGLEYFHPDGITIRVGQTNLPTSYQKEIAQEVANVYQQYSVPLQRAEALWQYLGKLIPQHKPQVVIDFKAANIVQYYFIELFVSNGDVLLLWGA